MLDSRMVENFYEQIYKQCHSCVRP
jgi:hypothetical protein